MKTIRTTAILAAALATACGGPATSPATTGAAQTTAQTYQSVGQNMATTAAQYQSATATMPDVAACRGAEATYQAQMGGMLDRMNALSPTMDRYMAGAMNYGVADMACVSAAMSAEYARHRAVACTATDMAANRTEALQHAATMGGWIDHQRVRYEQMGEAMGITPQTTDTTWACVHYGNGTFSMGGQTWTPPQTPPSPTSTPTPSPYPWPNPCGGWGCPCGGYGADGGTPGGGMP